MIKLNPLTLEKDLQNSIKDLKRDFKRLQKSREIVDRSSKSNIPIYGINTGFGALAQVTIPREERWDAQENLLLSHSAGVGNGVPFEIARIILGLKIHSLGLGFSGISPRIVRRLIRFFDEGFIPYIPRQGSVGASGDLAPLAHMALPLMGRGKVWDQNRKIIPARKALNRLGVRPIKLREKDGLALINGTQFMAGYGVEILQRANHLTKLADIAGAISVEGVKGSHAPFAKKLHELRPYKGQLNSAFNLRRLLSGSKINRSHRDCGRVQDPYSFRCIPQVHGACRDAIDYLNSVLSTEINSVTDNPIVLEDGEIISGGNFHGEPLAFALDLACMAITELASISERRTFALMNGLGGLPRFLTLKEGTNSGFMVAQYTAASLVSHNKVLSHPASVDSIPTSLNQEDHVSMGSVSALKCYDALKNTERVLAIEILAGLQAIDLHRPLKSGKGIEETRKIIRKHISFVKRDREIGKDIEKCLEIVKAQEFVSQIESVTGKLK